MKRVVDERCFCKMFLFCVPVLQGGIIKQVPVKIQSEGRGASVLAVGRERVLSFLNRGRVCMFARKPKMSVRGVRNIEP
jgi:hypothetical protein